MSPSGFTPTFSLQDKHGRKYLSAGELSRFISSVREEARPTVQTFCLTLVHTGARISEVLALRAMDIDVDVLEVRIRTLKRRREHWRAVPVPKTFVRELDLVHHLRSCHRSRSAALALWPWSRATGARHVKALMRAADVQGPMACAKGVRHSFGIAAVQAGVPLPTVAAMLGHANLSTTAIYTTALGIEARELMSRMWVENE